MAASRARRRQDAGDFLDRVQRGRGFLTVGLLAVALGLQLWSPAELEVTSEHVGLSALLVMTALGVAPYERWMIARP